MSKSSIGVAVIGAGMAGRAHASGYRSAPAVFGTDLPDVRLVAIADAYEPFAADTARRFGYQRAETSWQAIAAAADVDVVSVVVANALHREVVEGLLAAGKHVLCEKPLAPTIADGEAMVAAAEASDRVSRGRVHLPPVPGDQRDPEQVRGGALGPAAALQRALLVRLRRRPGRPDELALPGGPGSGALADIGSHLVDLGEFLCGPVGVGRAAPRSSTTVNGPRRAARRGGRARRRRRAERRARAGARTRTSPRSPRRSPAARSEPSRLSRVAYGHANALGFEVFLRARRGGVRPRPGRPSSRSPTQRRPRP